MSSGGDEYNGASVGPDIGSSSMHLNECDSEANKGQSRRPSSLLRAKTMKPPKLHVITKTSIKPRGSSMHSKSPKSPKSPRSPKSPKFIKTQNSKGMLANSAIFSYGFDFNNKSNRLSRLQLQNEDQNDTTEQPQSPVDPQPTPHHYFRQTSGKTSRGGSQRQIRVGKTTTVLFAVTLAYILSFLPYLIVMVMRSIIKDLESSLTPLGELAYKFCVKSFFINNAINPLIYSFLNQSFRQDAKVMFRKLCGRTRSLR